MALRSVFLTFRPTCNIMHYGRLTCNGINMWWSWYSRFFSILCLMLRMEVQYCQLLVKLIMKLTFSPNVLLPFTSKVANFLLTFYRVGWKCFRPEVYISKVLWISTFLDQENGIKGEISNWIIFCQIQNIWSNLMITKDISWHF